MTKEPRRWRRYFEPRESEWASNLWHHHSTLRGSWRFCFAASRNCVFSNRTWQTTSSLKRPSPSSHVGWVTQWTDDSPRRYPPREFRSGRGPSEKTGHSNVLV